MMLKGRPSPHPDIPQLPRSPFWHAALITPADRTGAVVDFFPVHAAFPVQRAGRHPRLHFRGLLKLHSRCGLPDCLPAYSGRLSRGSDPASYPTEPLGSYHAHRHLHGWILPPLVICAVGGALLTTGWACS